MSLPSDICLGELQVQRHEHAVFFRGQEVPLTSREFDIVMTLAEHPGWVFSAKQLSGDTDEGDYSPESVSVLVSRIRQKLTTSGAPDLVETVRGFGYRLHAPEGPCEEPAAAVAANRELRDTMWQLQEAVIEVEHTGSLEQKESAADALIRARREIFASLAE